MVKGYGLTLADRAQGIDPHRNIAAAIYAQILNHPAVLKLGKFQGGYFCDMPTDKGKSDTPTAGPLGNPSEPTTRLSAARAKAWYLCNHPGLTLGRMVANAEWSGTVCGKNSIAAMDSDFPTELEEIWAYGYLIATDQLDEEVARARLVKHPNAFQAVFNDLKFYDL